MDNGTKTCRKSPRESALKQKSKKSAVETEAGSSIGAVKKDKLPYFLEIQFTAFKPN